MRYIFKFLSWIAPKTFAKKAFYALVTPKKREISKNKQQFSLSATTSILHYKNRKITTYNWNSHNDKIAFIVHGWESMALDYQILIERLIEEKYQIISFDAPAHGVSSGEKTNLIEFKEVFGMVVNKEELKKIDLLIGHSIGGTALALALNENSTLVKVKHLFLLGSPSNVTILTDNFCSLLGLSTSSSNYLKTLIKKNFHTDLEDVNRTIIKKVNAKNIFLFYDRYDKVVRYAEGENFAHNWGITIQEFKKIGHHNIIKNEEVISKIIDIIRS